MISKDIKYKVVAEFVKQNRILLENSSDSPVLYRVDINHRLVKLVYIEPRSSKSFISQGEIKDLQIKELK